MQAKMVKYVGQQVYDITPDFIMSASLGKIDGVSVMRKFAYLPNIQSTTGERDIWEFGSTAAPGANLDYTYPPDGQAPINRLSSSSVLDTGNIYLEGLFADGSKSTEVYELNGQSKVVINPLWRSYRLANRAVSVGADRSEGFNGQIYVYEDTVITAGVPDDKTKVRAFLNNGNNSSLMSQYCTPKGMTGLFIEVEPRLVKKGAASIILKAYVRTFGEVFRLVDVGALSASGTSVFSAKNYIPIQLAEKSDVVFTADSDTNNVGASIVMYMLLFDNEKWAII